MLPDTGQYIIWIFGIIIVIVAIIAIIIGIRKKK
ncbi:LPXTG cell wall anchor domain-containing protein [endosymbiont 'TC1' of Trimyema compressum]|nr:LPXTG cell wall anchor domain-containing protein [endosymbiont 'TC1' of Trimyema compressum]